MSLYLQPAVVCIFVSIWCSGCCKRKTADKSWHTVQQQPRYKKNHKDHYPKNVFITVKTQKSLKYFQRQNERDSVKQRNSQRTRRTVCHGSHFLKNQFHRMTTQKWHLYIIIIIIIELLNHYYKSHTLIQSKQFALWLLFHPLILSPDRFS